MISNRLIPTAAAVEKPDDISIDVLRKTFPPDMVISRNADGSTNSVYRDMVWDFTPYSTSSVKFYFKAVGRFQFLPEDSAPVVSQAITEEIKRIIACLMYAPELQTGNRSPVNKPLTLKPYLKLLKRIGWTSAKSGKPLSELEADDKFLDYLISSSLGLSCSDAGNLKSLIIYTHRLAAFGYEGVPLLVSQERFSEFVDNLENIYRRKKLQSEESSLRTFLIPSRIYANYIIGCLKQVKECEDFVDAAFNFFSDMAEDPFLGVRDRKEFSDKIKKYGFPESVLAQYDIKKCVPRYELIKRHGLDKFEYHNIEGEVADFSEESGPSQQNVRKKLKRIQSFCMLLCHAFTGMRSHEIQVVSADSFEVHKIGTDREIPFLRSHTSKINQDNYSKPAYWVTSWELQDVTRIAVKIARVACLVVGKKETENIPMFPSLWADLALNDNHPHFAIPLRSDPNYMVKDINPVIEGVGIREEDIEELESFDMFVDWRAIDKVEVGAKWPVSSHQFRRSLAVYGAKSGLVSLSSLSVQFKHMTEAMTSLYAENSTFALSFIEESSKDKHRSQKSFADDLIQMRRLSEALNFSDTVINAEGRLSGGTGKIIQKFKDTESIPTWLRDRDETKKRFLDGQQTYRDTVLGGCTNPDPCDKAGLGGVHPCPDCEFSVSGGDDGAKESAYLESLELSLSFLQPGTPAYDAILVDIQRIKSSSRGDS